MDEFAQVEETAEGDVVDGQVVEVEVVEIDVVEIDVVDGDDESVDDLLLLEEAQDPLVLQVWEPTGEPRVDAALDRLAELDPDDVHQHAAIFDDIHQQLRATLTDLDATS